MSDGFALTTPAELTAFQVLRVRSMLGLEIKTGMSHSQGSLMNLAKSYCGSPKRTKKGVYADYNAWLVENGFESRPL